jgi:hypothetical protein
MNGEAWLRPAHPLPTSRQTHGSWRWIGLENSNRRNLLLRHVHAPECWSGCRPAFLRGRRLQHVVATKVCAAGLALFSRFRRVRDSLSRSIGRTSGCNSAFWRRPFLAFELTLTFPLCGSRTTSSQMYNAFATGLIGCTIGLSRFLLHACRQPFSMASISQLGTQFLLHPRIPNAAIRFLVWWR